MQNVQAYDAEAENDDHTVKAKRQPKQPTKAHPEPEDEVRPLVISEAHANFSLDKKQTANDSIGEVNDRHIVCQFCEIIILPEGNAVKQHLDANFIQNTMREYDICSSVWAVDSMRRFQNVEIHQLDSELKYLCCLSC